MQLDISLSESQIIEAKLANVQNELQLERSRREELEKQHTRLVLFVVCSDCACSLQCKKKLFINKGSIININVKERSFLK